MHDQNKMLLWIGVNHESPEDYQKHFLLDYSTDGDVTDEKYSVCDFCVMLGIKWYDEDFIGIIPRKDEEVPITDLFDEVAVDGEELIQIKSICNKLGLSKSNSVLWYPSNGTITKPSVGDDFFGLKYIGCFNGD